MSETKASKIIKHVHDNDLGPSLFLAISNNDEEAFQSALRDASLTADDLTLSQDEYDSLVKGVKPSGELDILTWEGYYVVTSSSENDPLALLILVGTEKVYWGTQSQVLAHPDRHVVDYKITPENKIEFSTETDGLVSISLTREYDQDKTTAAVKFSGTRDGKAISGESTRPPIRCLNLQGPFRRKPPAPRMMMMMAMAANPEEKQWYENPTILSFATVFALTAGAEQIFRISRWIYNKAWRLLGSTQVKQALEEHAPLMREVGRDSYREPEVNYSGASSAVHSSIVSDLNQSMHDNPPNYQRSPDDLTREYEPRGRDAAALSLPHYIETRSMPDIRRSMDRFSAIPGHEAWVRQFGAEVAINMAEPKVEALAPFDSVVRPVVLQALHEFFGANYQQAETNLQAKEEELRESRQKVAELQDEVTRLNQEIKERKERGEDTSSKEERRAELDKEQRQAEEEQREKEKKRDDAEQERKEAERREKEAEHEKKTDRSKEEWERKAEKVFKPRE